MGAQPRHPRPRPELRDEVESQLPKIVRLVLEDVELRPGDAELLADAVITDLDGTEARLGVASFTLDELAERYPNLGLGLVNRVAPVARIAT